MVQRILKKGKIESEIQVDSTKQAAREDQRLTGRPRQSRASTMMMSKMPGPIPKLTHEPRLERLRVAMIGSALLVLSLELGCSRRDTMRPEKSSPAPTGSSKAAAAVKQRTPDPDWIRCLTDEHCPLSIMSRAFARCGTVQVNPRFVGRYDVDASRSFRGPLYDQPDADAKKKEMAAWFLKRQIEMYSNFIISRERIQSGKQQVQDFCFIEVESETDRVLDAIAVWHEDVDDPGDASLIRVRLELDGAEARFRFYAEEADLKGEGIFLRVFR